MTAGTNGKTPVPDPERLSSAALVEVELAALGAAFAGTADETRRVLTETRAEHYTGVRETLFRALQHATTDGPPDPGEIASYLRERAAPVSALLVLDDIASWPTAAGLDRTIALLEKARRRRVVASWASRIAAAEGDAARAGLLERAHSELSTAREEQIFGPLPVTNLRDILDAPAEEPAWFVPGLLGRRRMTILTAAPKTGKSASALGVAMRLAAGLSGTWLGTDFRLSGGANVLYLSAEGGRRLIQTRYPLLARGLPTGWESSFRLLTERPWPRLDTPDGLAVLRATLAKHPTDLLVLDPLARFRDLENENDNAATQAFTEGLRDLIDDFNLAALLVHHPSKASVSDREATSFQGGRGASALFGDVDTAISLRKDTKSTEIHAYFELRDAEPIEPGRRLLLNRETLWLDSLGDLGNTCQKGRPSPIQPHDVLTALRGCGDSGHPWAQLHSLLGCSRSSWFRERGRVLEALAGKITLAGTTAFAVPL